MYERSARGTAARPACPARPAGAPICVSMCTVTMPHLSVNIHTTHICKYTETNKLHAQYLKHVNMNMKYGIPRA